MAGQLTAAEAAHRLGVKPATLYAYVSRGVLTRRKDPAGRTSRYDAQEIEDLARRGRPRRPAHAADIVVESALTEIDGAQFRYRGRDVSGLATSRSLEEVAEFLWTGEFPGHPEPWRARPEALAVGRAAQAALPAGALPLERLQVIVPAMAATDPLRLQLDPPAVRAAARGLITGLVDCLPAPGDAGLPSGPPDPAAPIAERLWSRLTSRRPAPGLLAAVSAALVLLADHELAASTLAARVAASVRADPYAVVATGLGAVSGALHGGASLGAENLLTAAATPAGVPAVIRDLLRRGERVPGFGHFVYRGGDPRAARLLGLIAAAAPRSRVLAVADAVRAEVGGRGLPGPNIDFALAVLSRAAGMIDGAGEAIFAVARTAGWSAHAMEEYVRATPLRPRAVYVGPAPQDPGGQGS
ncbi:MAG TPA: citrate/2-methylcitrate synthase [Streptosporangiaceae bacterium]|jgi:citrate synthase|nr:citrate/2-methylcitrate synthase [Streptosporangiaceae bacterium]